MKYEVLTPSEHRDILILRTFKKKFFFERFRIRETAFFKEGGPTYAHKGGTNHRNRYCNWYLVVFIGVIFIEHTLKTRGNIFQRV